MRRFAKVGLIIDILDKTCTASDDHLVLGDAFKCCSLKSAKSGPAVRVDPFAQFLESDAFP